MPSFQLGGLTAFGVVEVYNRTPGMGSISPLPSLRLRGGMQSVRSGPAASKADTENRHPRIRIPFVTSWTRSRPTTLAERRRITVWQTKWSCN